MKIRLARSGDLGVVIGIDPVAQPEASHRKFLEAALQSGECWLAEQGGVPLGFVVLQYSFYGNGFVPLLVVQRCMLRMSNG
jgi:hypothetical protein